MHMPHVLTHAHMPHSYAQHVLPCMGHPLQIYAHMTHTAPSPTARSHIHSSRDTGHTAHLSTPHTLTQHSHAVCDTQQTQHTRHTPPRPDVHRPGGIRHVPPSNPHSFSAPLPARQQGLLIHSHLSSTPQVSPHVAKRKAQSSVNSDEPSHTVSCRVVGSLSDGQGAPPPGDSLSLPSSDKTGRCHQQPSRDCGRVGGAAVCQLCLALSPCRPQSSSSLCFLYWALSILPLGGGDA